MDQAHFPSELMREQDRLRLAAILVEDQLTEGDGHAVPVGALEDLERHEGRDRSTTGADPLDLSLSERQRVNAPGQ
jgi:hypothetical protein